MRKGWKDLYGENERSMKSGEENKSVGQSLSMAYIKTIIT